MTSKLGGLVMFSTSVCILDSVCLSQCTIALLCLIDIGKRISYNLSEASLWCLFQNTLCFIFLVITLNDVTV